MNVIPYHTFQTLKEIDNYLKYYYSKEDPSVHKDAIKQEQRWYASVLSQTRSDYPHCE